MTAVELVRCTACPDQTMIGQRVAVCAGCGGQRWYGRGRCTRCGYFGPASCPVCNNRGWVRQDPEEGRA